MDWSRCPEDLLFEVLHRTNARTVGNFYSTCKSFKAVATSDRIWKFLFDHNCRRRDAYAAGYVNTSELYESEPTFRDKYRKWVEFVWYSTAGIVKLMNTPTASSPDLERKLSVFSQKCLNPSFYHQGGSKREWAEIVRSVTERLEATPRRKSSLMIKSDVVYAELWTALIHMAIYGRIQPAVLVSPAAAALRYHSMDWTQRWYPRFNIALSLLSFFLSTSVDNRTYLLTFVPIWTAWLFWSPQTLIYALRGPLSLYLFGKSMLTVDSSESLMYLALIPSTVSLVMGFKGIFWSIFYLFGWYLRFSNLSDLLPDSPYLSRKLLVNVFGSALQAPSLTLMVLFVWSVAAESLRALLLWPSPSKRILVSLSQRFCRWRRLQTHQALQIAEWVTKPSPAEEIHSLVQKNWKEIVMHPESGGLGDLLLAVLPSVASIILSTCVTVFKHFRASTQ